MEEKFSTALTKLQIPSYKISGITVFHVNTSESGVNLASTILQDGIDKSFALYLSGGRTPKDLYTKLSGEGKLTPGCAGLVDERYGEPFHENSNELMLRETGILEYFEKNNIPFANILEGKSRNATTADYDEKIRELFAVYKKHAAVLGVGLDGHTAGIPSDLSVWQEEDISRRSKTEMVIDYDDHGKFYNERISMSFLPLSMMDVLVVMVFGQDKARALEWMFADGPEEEVPSRFFKRPDIAKKTILITDQNIH